MTSGGATPGRARSNDLANCKIHCPGSRHAYCFALLKRSSTFFEGKRVHLGDLDRGCSDLEMTWLSCCAA